MGPRFAWTGQPVSCDLEEEGSYRKEGKGVTLGVVGVAHSTLG